MDESDFHSNLGLLCSYERSIADVCRQIGMNRQQFNKYLASQVFPSRRNLRVICDHFGVTESEILLPHQSFAEMISLKSRSGLSSSESALPTIQTLERLHRQSELIPDRYLGYYFRYYYSFAFPGYITKSLVSIFRNSGAVYWKNIEILRRRDRREGVQTVFKYRGLVSLISERLFVLEEETLLKNSVTQTILYPSYTSRIRHLIGIQTAASNLNRRIPAASRVVLEFIANKIDVRLALAACGQYREKDPGISKEVKIRIRNEVGKRGKVLAAWSES